MTARFIIGDVFDCLAKLPDDSIDLVLSSPPFLALRSYLPADHPDKAKEIGSEATPADFLDTLLDVVEACDRVLAPHGSLVFELGDTYSGSGGAGGDYSDDGLREGQPTWDSPSSRARSATTVEPTTGLVSGAARTARESWKGVDAKNRGNTSRGTARRQRENASNWPLAKSLTGIPTLFAWSLAYGRNLLRPERTTDPWRIRNLVCWNRPNPPVGALGDKMRPATSYLTVATKSRTRYFDLDSCRSGSPGATSRAVQSVSDSLEVTTTLGAGDHRPARGWCDTGRSQIAVGPPVAWEAQRLQVVDPIGFLVGIEQIEGPQVMDLEALGRPADPALVAIAVQRFLSCPIPVATPVGRAASVPTGVVLASNVDAAPLASTLKTAKVVRQDLALVAGQWLAARITLDLDGTRCTAFAIAPVTGSVHNEQSSSKYPTSENGAPPLDWIEMDEGEFPSYLVIPTSPYRGSHYATWSPDLVVPFIKSMCPERVCRVCGEPSRRITGPAEYHQSPNAHGSGRAKDDIAARKWESGIASGRNQSAELRDGGVVRVAPTLGWTDCGHDDYRPGCVLDPFAGSGTTLMVATGHGRDAVGIDLDARNADLATERVGMFLEVEHTCAHEITITHRGDKWFTHCSVHGLVGRYNTSLEFAEERKRLHEGSHG